MIKFARHYYPPKYFENFEEVVKRAYNTIVEACKGIKLHRNHYDPAKTQKELSKVKEKLRNKFFNYNFKSPTLGITILFRIDDTFPRESNMFFYSGGWGEIYIPWHNIKNNPDNYLSMGLQMFTNIAAHELQHAIDYHFLRKPLQHHGKDLRKMPSWTNYDNPDFPEYEQWQYYIKYVNDPAEVRANLVQLIHIFNLPKDKELYLKHISQQIKQGEGASKVYVDLINEAYKIMLENVPNIPDSIRNNFLILFTPQARKYLIKGVYDAINN